MAINVERITKQLVKLGALEEKINNLQGERDTIASEIQSLLGNTSVPMSKTTTGTKNGKTPTLGDRIVTYLQGTPGGTIQTIAKALKVAPNQVGLSLHHLTKKGSTFHENSMYYASVPLAAAAKTAIATTDEAETD